MTTGSLFNKCWIMPGKRSTSGKRSEDLNKERLLELALVRLVEIIGEAAGRVSKTTQSQYPEIPWREIISMRNRLIHGYDSFDLDVLWNTVALDLPPLISHLEKILKP